MHDDEFCINLDHSEISINDQASNELNNDIKILNQNQPVEAK